MRNWLRTLLFLSAFSPSFISLAIVRWWMQGLSVEIYQLAAIGILGTLLPLLIINMVQTSVEILTIQPKKIEPNDFMLMVFVVSYLLPLGTKLIEASIEMLTGLLFLLGIILWLMNSLPTHPVLRIFRFRFYKLEADNGIVYTLITRREINDGRIPMKVMKISNGMLMEYSKDHA